MIRNDFHKVVSCLFLLHVMVFAAAQGKTSVKVSADKNKIVIGERMHLTFEADIPENEPIRFFILDTIPHFEMQRQKVDTTYTREGTFLKQVITLTSFDSGRWVIPSFSLGDNLQTDSIPVDVVFSAMDSAQDYHDIKDIIDVKPAGEKKKWWLWYVIGGSGLLIILLLAYFLRKKRPVTVAAAAVINPFEDAMNELDRLQRENPDRKLYYSRLIDIFRGYADKKKSIHSLQKTTDDLVVQLKSIPISKVQFEKLSQALRLGDFVKFAKYVPSGDDDRDTFETIKKAIIEIEQVK